jgi:hypothetical protein
MRFLLTLLFATSTVASAADLPDVLKCRGIATAEARLACYDRFVDQLQASPQAGRPRTPAAAGAPARAEFGLENRARSAQADEMRSSIDGAIDGWEPSTRFRLANGQVWQVIDGTRGAYLLRSPAVRISRGVMGNFFLQIDGVNQAISVRRVD